jgi:hypothetical protein
MAREDKGGVVKYIYLASPYSHEDAYVMEERFRAVCEAAAAMMRRGEFVYSPIAHSHPIAKVGGLPKGWEYWQEFDEIMIRNAGKLVVLMLDGWMESEGVAAEIQLAEKLGIPVEWQPKRGD